MQAVTRLASMETALGAELHRALDRAARAIQTEAKREIGHYQGSAGRFAAWQPLATTTLKEKARLGYSPPDNPLKRTGTLRASIERRVEDIVPGEVMRAEIGADGVVAVVQSLGAPAKNIPARDFLGHAAVRKEHEVVEAVGEAAALAFGVRGGALSRIR